MSSVMRSISLSGRSITSGAGFEYAIMPNVSLGFEYDHLFMGGNDVTFASNTVDHIKQDVDIFTARLNYKFGGPMMPRY